MRRPTPYLRTGWAMAALLCVSLPLATAQEPTAPAQPPAEGAVALAFKHTAGRTQSFKATVNADLSLTPTGGAGLGPLPLTMKSVVAYDEKVTGTRQGTGTITIRTRSLTINTNAAGTHAVVRIRDGKATTTINGKPAPPGTLGAMTAAPPLVTLRRDPAGRLSAAAAGQPPPAFLSNNTIFSMVEFPDRPVSVGESWESTQSLRIPLPGAGGVQSPEMEVRYTHTLKELQTRGEARHALIESTGSGTGGGAETGLSQDVNGVTRFDITRGVIVSGKYRANLGLRIPIPQAAAPEGDTPSGVQVDGQLDITFAEAPAPPAAGKAASQKPAPRKPARKK